MNDDICTTDALPDAWADPYTCDHTDAEWVTIDLADGIEALECPVCGTILDVP